MPALPRPIPHHPDAAPDLPPSPRPSLPPSIIDALSFALPRITSASLRCNATELHFVVPTCAAGTLLQRFRHTLSSTASFRLPCNLCALSILESSPRSGTAPHKLALCDLCFRLTLTQICFYQPVLPPPQSCTATAQPCTQCLALLAHLRPAPSVLSLVMQL